MTSSGSFIRASVVPKLEHSHIKQCIVQAQMLPGNLKHRLCEEVHWQRWLSSSTENMGPWGVGKLMLVLFSLPCPWPYEDFGRQFTEA